MTEIKIMHFLLYDSSTNAPDDTNNYCMVENSIQEYRKDGWVVTDSKITTRRISLNYSSSRLIDASVDDITNLTGSKEYLVCIFERTPAAKTLYGKEAT